MNTDELDNLKKIVNWLDEILDKADGLTGALHNAGLTTESDLATLSINRLESIYTRVKDKIENANVMTETEPKIILTDSFINKES